MKILKSFLILFVVVVAGFASFKFLTREKPECLLIVNSRYFDYKSSSYILNKVILIKNSLITDIYDYTPEFNLNKTCQIINLKNHFLFPGLIDAHTHLLAEDKQRVPDWKTALELSASRPEMTRLFIGEKNAKSMLLSGFTTVRDLGNSGAFLDEQLKSLIYRKSFIGPEIITSGPGLAVSPSQINLNKNSSEYAVINENSDLSAIFNLYKTHHVSWLKLYADNSAADSLMNENLLKKITQAAQGAGFKVAIHAEYSKSIANALNAKPESIEHFYKIPDESGQEIINSSFIVLTDYSLNTCEKSKLTTDCISKIGSLRERLLWLKKNNFKIVFGSDAVLDFTTQFKSRGDASLASLISLQEIGLSHDEAITAATSTAADMLGLPIGKIEKSLVADLVAYESDPLADLQNLKKRVLIISRGEIVCQNTSECQP